MVLKSFKKHPMLLLLMITMHIKLFYVSQILFQKSTALKSLIKVIPMLLLHVMMMLTKLFSVSQILYEKKLAFEIKIPILLLQRRRSPRFVLGIRLSVSERHNLAEEGG